MAFFRSFSVHFLPSQQQLLPRLERLPLNVHVEAARPGVQFGFQRSLAIPNSINIKQNWCRVLQMISSPERPLPQANQIPPHSPLQVRHTHTLTHTHTHTLSLPLALSIYHCSTVQCVYSKIEMLTKGRSMAQDKFPLCVRTCVRACVRACECACA